MDKIFREFITGITFMRSYRIDYPAHIHESIELILVKKGGGTAYCDGKEYTLKENSFFLVFPNQVHHYKDCAIGEYILLTVKPSNLLAYGNAFYEGAPLSANWNFEETGDDNIVNLLEMALEEYMRDGHNTIVDGYLTVLLGKLLKFYEIQKAPLSTDSVSQILQYCARHYKENISVEDVSKELHISKCTISHIFSSRLAMNFCDHINSLRLIDAITLLKNKKLSITEVSYLSGFGTIRTFNRAFLKHYGISPSEFRRKFLDKVSN